MVQTPFRNRQAGPDGAWAGTPEGNKAEPRRPALKNLNVSIGHYDAFPAFGQMVKGQRSRPLLRRSFHDSADGRRRSFAQALAAGEFLQQAITNVREAFPFPKDIHYMIARGGFLDRLSKL